MRNYLKAVLLDKSSHTFFFEDTILESIQDAYAMANELPNAKISIFKPAPIPGPWDRAAVVGHRHRDDIKADMKRTADTEKLFWLKEELDAADNVWLDAGRETVPMGAAA